MACLGTEALYLTASYAKEQCAKVIMVDGSRVMLDKTIFYPEGGGQPTDTGRLFHEDDGKKEEYVIKEVKKHAGQHWHFLDREPSLKAGDEVRIELDWHRRYCHMRYHSSLHVLSKVVYKEFGAQVSGNQIYADRARMDFTLEEMTPEIIKKTEDKANEIISSNKKINIVFLPREEATKKVDPHRTRLDLLPPAITTIRLVEIEGFDVDACAGTHVNTTGEIGKLAITKTENKGKGKRRMEIKLE